MELLPLIVIFVAGLVGGAFGTLVGGGSLLTIPTLMLMGLPPHTAIGTDRMGQIGVGLAGLYSFHRKGMVCYGLALAVGIPNLLGAFIGANLALQISPELMKRFIIALTVLLLLFVAVNPRVGVAMEKGPLGPGAYFWGGLLSLLVGVYGGFYGAGAATFQTYIMLFIFRQTFLESAANLKVATVLMTLTSAVTYAYNGAIHLPLGTAQFAGASIGSYLGVRYSDRIGNAWIKRLFIGVIFLMALKLLLG